MSGLLLIIFLLIQSFELAFLLAVDDDVIWCHLLPPIMSDPVVDVVVVVVVAVLEDDY